MTSYDEIAQLVPFNRRHSFSYHFINDFLTVFLYNVEALTSRVVWVLCLWSLSSWPAFLTCFRSAAWAERPSPRAGGSWLPRRKPKWGLGLYSFLGFPLFSLVGFELLDFRVCFSRALSPLGAGANKWWSFCDIYRDALTAEQLSYLPSTTRVNKNPDRQTEWQIRLC